LGLMQGLFPDSGEEQAPAPDASQSLLDEMLRRNLQG
jgi:hypothetical protein